MRLLTALCACLLAQAPIGPDEVSGHAAPYAPVFAGGTIRAQVEVVEVPVVVRDGKGMAVPGLTRQDFEVFDAGKKQEITEFSIETISGTVPAAAASQPAGDASLSSAAVKPAAPKRFIALVLDDLNTDFANLRRAKIAADRFVSTKLAPGDLVGVFTTALSETVLFTADPEKLKKAIDAVSPHPRYSDEKHSCPVITAYSAYEISSERDPELLNAKAGELMSCTKMARDAAIEAVRMMSRAIWANARQNSDNTLDSIASVVTTMSRMPGQRIVLLTSGGFIAGDEEMRMDAITGAARHSGVVINSLDLKGLYAIVPGGEASEPGRKGPVAMRIQIREEDSKDDGLAILALGTGGQFFHNNNSVDEGLRRLGAAPDLVYVLGFAAGDVPHDGKYHPLKVRLTGGHHGSVQFRMGYNAPPKDLPSEVVRQSERDRLLMGAGEPADVAVRVTEETGADTGPKVAIRTWIDVGRLNFEKKAERRNQTVTVIAALLNPAGDFVVGRQAATALTLKDAAFAELARSGLTVQLSLHAAAGTYTLRVLVQEDVSGKMTAVSRRLELR